MKLPSIRSFFLNLLKAPLRAIGLSQVPSPINTGPIPRSFSEAMRFGEDERPRGPLEHSSEQPLGTPEFDHIGHEERRLRRIKPAA